MQVGLLVPFIVSLQLSAVDVTSSESRRQTLLEYVAGREDLTAAEKKGWEKAVRSAFGGKAIKDGTDEGVTVAKSVIAAAIFFGVKPEVASKAAYEAYHDTYRWVPPPIAINYQILKFQGRKPKAASRQLAFDFPRYFNEEIAADLVTWWDEMLEKGAIPDYEQDAVREALRATRRLMRPMLLERLLRAAEVEARAQGLRGRGGGGAALREVEDELARLRKELTHDFKGVPESREVKLAGPDYYASYSALARELGRPTEPRPTFNPAAAPPKLAPPKVERPKTEPPKADKPKKDKPKDPPPTREVIAPAQPEPSPQVAERGRERVPAPFPGDPLLPLFPGWKEAMHTAVGGWLGAPYLLGGVDRRGIDCSAFVREVFRESINVELPRNSRAQFGVGTKVEQSGLSAGDLIFFDTMDRGQVTHVGVYLGDGEFAHASSSRGVVRDKLAGRYYQRAYWGSKRILKN